MTKETPSLGELVSTLGRMRAQAKFLGSAGYAKFAGDDIEADMHQLAASHLVMQFSALLDDVPETIRLALPSLPWPQVKGMRNRLAHGYSDIDTETLWQVVAVDLPHFADALLGELESD